MSDAREATGPQAGTKPDPLRRAGGEAKGEAQ
jgi:hypothetical protein